MASRLVTLTIQSNMLGKLTGRMELNVTHLALVPASISVYTIGVSMSAII